MLNLSILDSEFAELTKVDQQVFWILGNNFFHFFEDVVQNDFGGLLLDFSQLRNCNCIDLNCGEREVSSVLHFHAVLDEEFFSQANEDLF